MKDLTVPLLGRACRTFFRLAYPEGEHTISAAKRPYLDPDPRQPLAALLVPPVCQALPGGDGGTRGYAFRLGSTKYPHLKLQVTACGDECVFSVDTHDRVQLAPDHPDAGRWAELQAANRRLKEAIERAWEDEGLLTFNGLLRRALVQG